MASSIFVSYSRREVTFVDDLVARLQGVGHKVWLDYRNLVPGSPWSEQINKGIDEADTFLFIISHESMQSKYVEAEWRRVLGLGKRVVLAIFEATKLPPELQHLEWIDFRTSFEQGCTALDSLLSSEPKTVQKPAPQSGFKAPKLVWLTFALSTCASLLGLASIWTLYLPFFLAPLPFQILKREYKFFHVQASLLMLPLALYFTGDFVRSDAVADLYEWLAIAAVFVSLALVGLLRSRTLHRWGKPMSTYADFENILNPKIAHPEPLHFALEFAPADWKYAIAMRRVLETHGHTYHKNPKEADVAVMLISRYNYQSSVHAEEQQLYPILLQDVDVAQLDPSIQKIQWIDFRKGIQEAGTLAKLLPHPEKLLAALGVVPLSGQVVVPAIVRAIIFFITITTILTVGGLITFLFQLGPDLFHEELLLITVGSALLLAGGHVGFAALTIRALVNRVSWLASWLGLFLMLAMMGLVGFLQTEGGYELMDWLGLLESDSYAGNSIGIFDDIVYIGFAILMIYSLFHAKTLNRWFPKR